MEKAYMDVTDENFEQEVLKSEIPVLVDFWAGWCRPCLALAPTVEELAVSYKGKVKVCKLNVDEARKTPERYGIMGIPTLLLFVNGEVVGKVVGSVPRDTLVALIKEHLQCLAK